MKISTHLLDTSLGKPGQGIPVTLESIGTDGAGTACGAGVTDADGRVASLSETSLEPGDYRLTFATAAYFEAAHGTVFYPRIVLYISLPAARDHFHIPVLASTFSYSTYLGS
ncbi:5-hydroxyisourate hydrolase [Nakamurella sp. UYEF19]|uniref:hydroxyisourate hydrolase n=1 Tax=Nakamurella sp. UYEF19 TaxID=1756392 RepID=UPI0033943665